MARKAALSISSSEESAAIGNELLADILEMFETKQVDKISMSDLVAALCEDEEKPWATYWHGKRLTPRQMSRRLKEYGIASKTVPIGYDRPKGYRREQFDDAFSRYLSTPLVSPVTQSLSSNDAGLMVTKASNVSADKKALVTVEAAPLLNSDRVTEEKGVSDRVEYVEDFI